MLTDREREETTQRAKRWVPSVARQDCSLEYAATTIAGDITYPCTTAHRWQAFRDLAASEIRKRL